MSTDPRDRVYADLVGGLLDARADPVTERFDTELEQAVQRGDVTAEGARRLRFWQRASLRSLTDHTRTVLPTVLGALEASRREAQKDVDELSAALGVARVDPRDARTSPDSAERERGEPDHDAQRSETVVDLRDTPGPTSTPAASGPSSLEGRRRLIVAGLVTAPTVRPQHD